MRIALGFALFLARAAGCDGLIIAGGDDRVVGGYRAACIVYR